MSIILRTVFFSIVLIISSAPVRAQDCTQLFNYSSQLTQEYFTHLRESSVFSNADDLEKCESLQEMKLILQKQLQIDQMCNPGGVVQRRYMIRDLNGQIAAACN